MRSLEYKHLYFSNQKLSTRIHSTKGTATLLIPKIYVSGDIGRELLKWLAPIWPLTIRKRKKWTKNKIIRTDRNTKTAPLLQIYVSGRDRHRPLIVHAQVSALPPGTSQACRFHSLQQTYYSRFFCHRPFSPFLFLVIPCWEEKLRQTNECY
jgi:hypothetical protein